MRRRYRPYDPREDGPLHRYTNGRPGYRRTVTVPERVSPHIKLVFAEMMRQQRTYKALRENRVADSVVSYDNLYRKHSAGHYEFPFSAMVIPAAFAAGKAHWPRS